MSRPSRGSASYRAVLALPHARSLFAAAMLARLSYGLLSLPLLLSVERATGSYAVAGTASGLFGLVTALLGPARARLVARRPGALLLLTAGCATLLAAIAAAGAAGGFAPWTAVALATAAGVFPPPVGPLMRTVWGLLASDRAQRQSALSLDTVSESTVFAVGPAVAGVLIGAVSAPGALAGCAGLLAVGFTALASALRRAPALRGTPALPGTPDRPAAAAPDRRGARGPLRTPGFAAVLLAVLASGAALALEEIAAVHAWGAGVTGLLLALCSAGGVAGGLAYGRLSWRAPLHRRLVLLAVGGAGCFALPAVAMAVPVAAAALLGAGAFGDTLLITVYLLVDERIAEGARTEAGAWVNTAYNLGVALGSGLAGLLLAGCGGVVPAAAAVLAGAGALAAAASGRGAVHSPPAAARLSGADDGDFADAELLDRRGN